MANRLRSAVGRGLRCVQISPVGLAGASPASVMTQQPNSRAAAAGEIPSSKPAVKASFGEASKPAVRSVTRSLPHRYAPHVSGPRGSRAWRRLAKAMEAAKPWEAQLRRTLRCKGHGMQGQSNEGTGEALLGRARATREGVGAGHSTVNRAETTQLWPREGLAAGPCSAGAVRRRRVPWGTNRSRRGDRPQRVARACRESWQVEGPVESRVRENLMHGSGRG